MKIFVHVPVLASGGGGGTSFGNPGLDTYREIWNWIVSLYKKEFNIYGVSMTFMDVFVFCIISVLIIRVVMAVFAVD